MPTNPFVETRKQMKQLLFQMLNSNKNLDEDKIIGLFCLKTGIHEKTARQYLKELKDVFLIEQEKEETLKTQKTLTE